MLSAVPPSSVVVSSSWRKARLHPQCSTGTIMHPSLWHAHLYSTPHLYGIPIPMPHQSLRHTHPYGTSIPTAHPSLWHTNPYGTPIPAAYPSLWHPNPYGTCIPVGPVPMATPWGRIPPPYRARDVRAAPAAANQMLQRVSHVTRQRLVARGPEQAH